MQEYKSLCAAVVICATLVNTQTHTHTDMHRQTNEFYMTGSVPVELKLRLRYISSVVTYISCDPLVPVARNATVLFCDVNLDCQYPCTGFVSHVIISVIIATS